MGLDTPVIYSPTYETIRNLIVEDAIAELPKSLFDVVDIEFVSLLEESLIKMRKQGYAFIAYDKESKTYYSDKVSFDGYRYLLNYEQLINPEYIITLGNFEKPEEFRFKLSLGNLKDICKYENAVERIDIRDDKSTYMYIKSLEWQDAVETGNAKQVSIFKRKFKEFTERQTNHIIALGKDDELGSNQININNEAIKEIKEKLSLNLRIPYSKLWKGVASGFNSLDLDDRKKWNAKVVLFQITNILPAIKQYLKIDGREHDIKKVKIEPIENEDKEMMANIKSQTIEDITHLFSMGLMSKQQAQSKIYELLNINKE